MNFKEFILQKKKLVASVAIGMFLGTSFGFMGTVSKDEYIAHNEEKTTLISKVEEKQGILDSNEEELTILLSKETELQKQKEDILEKQSIAKAEAEKKAKEEEEAKKEAERLAKEEAERLAKEEAERVAQAEAEAQAEADRVAANNYYNEDTSYNDSSASEPIGQMVYKTATGTKYHSHNSCGNTNPANTTYITLEQAQSLGLTACSKCY